MIAGERPSRVEEDLCHRVRRAARQLPNLRRLSRRTATILAKLIADAQRAGQIGGGGPAGLSPPVLATISGLAASNPLGPSAAHFPSVDILMRLFGGADD